MTTATDKSAKPRPSAEARAEAAAWIARLHGPERTADVEAGFRQWLSEREEHKNAFEFMTETWEKSARLQRRPLERVASWQLLGFRLTFSRAVVASVAIAAVAILGTLFYLHAEGVTTGVGEQRTLVLRDGTRIYLNTSTQLVEHYDRQTRRIELKEGEAIFEVAQNADWPFIVSSGGRQVRALGTSFIVRRDEEQLAVTLLEGKVAVSDQNDAEATGYQEGHAPVTLAPGERLTFARTTQPPKIDRPSIGKVTSWQRGQVDLDGTPLGEAVVEMNRYSKTRLVVEDARAAALPISGVFRAGDQENFAVAVSRAYGLQMRAGSDQIVLGGAEAAR